MLPIFLNLADRLGVVVGGSAVGRRKAAALLAGGARVRVICLEPRPADLVSPRLDWLTRPYGPQHLEAAALVFAAATASVNRQVAADAHARGVWVNVADDPTRSDFFLPATVRRGAFVLATSTGGAAPALAREIRTWLESQFDDTFGQWVDLLAELRPLIQAEVADAPQRRALWRRLCQKSWLERLRGEGPSAVRAALLAEVRTLAQKPDNPL